MIEVKRCAVTDLLAHPNMPALLAEYAVESAIPGMPSPTPDFETYKKLEASGGAVALGLFHDDQLIGFLHILVYLNPHYSTRLAVVESFFVGGEHRNTGGGLMLLHEAETVANERDARGIFISAPAFGRLAAVMSRLSRYTETNRVFFQGLH